jgi:hypothetical protein
MTLQLQWLAILMHVLKSRKLANPDGMREYSKLCLCISLVYWQESLLDMRKRESENESRAVEEQACSVGRKKSETELQGTIKMQTPTVGTCRSPHNLHLRPLLLQCLQRGHMLLRLIEKVVNGAVLHVLALQQSIEQQRHVFVP